MNEWKLVRNPDYLTYDIFLDFLMVVLLVSGYAEHLGAWRKLCVLAFAAVAILYIPVIRDALSGSRGLMVTGLSLLLLLSLCTISSISDVNTSNNMKGLIYAFCPSTAYTILTADGLTRIRQYLIKRLPLLNIVHVFNLYVLSRQIQGTGFMIKASWLAQNSYYKDQCSGIFGFNSTHACGLFSIFMLLLNLTYLSECKGRTKRLLFGAYTLLTEAVMIYCAAFSDNMALYVLTPFFVVLYFYLTRKELGVFSFIRAHIKAIVISILICAAALYMLLSMPAVREFADKVYLRLYRVIFFNEIGVQGSNERLAILADALSMPFGWKLGYGIGEEPWRGQYILGYHHFGISSIGSTVYLCGIWTFIILTAFVVYMSVYPLARESRFGAYMRKAFFVTALSLIMMTVYTTIYIDIRKMLLFLLIMTAMQIRIDDTCPKTDASLNAASGTVNT